MRPLLTNLPCGQKPLYECTVTYGSVVDPHPDPDPDLYLCFYAFRIRWSQVRVGSGSFHIQAKIVRKTSLISTVCHLFMT
jgi:hypothetical protein